MKIRVMAERTTEGTSRRRISWPLILAAVLIVGGIWFVMSRQDGGEETVELPAGQTQYSQAALVDEVNAKIYAKDYDTAINIIQGQDQAEQPRIKQMLVSVYAAKGDLPAALAVYDELDKAGQLDGGNSGAAGDMAVRAKDYAKAREFYGKAIERLGNENQPTANDDIALYRYRLAEIKDK